MRFFQWLATNTDNNKSVGSGNDNYCFVSFVATWKRVLFARCGVACTHYVRNSCRIYSDGH